MCTISNHYSDFITLLFSSSARYNCSQTITPILLRCRVPSIYSTQSQHHCLKEPWSDRSLARLCLLRQSCGNHPSKSSPIAWRWSRFQSCSNIWPAIRPYLTSHLPEMFRTAQRPFFVCNFNLYTLFPWDIITLLKWKITSVYIRKITLLQKMWKLLHDKSSTLLARNTTTHKRDKFHTNAHPVNFVGQGSSYI